MSQARARAGDGLHGGAEWGGGDGRKPRPGWGMSERQLRRVLAAYRAEGPAGVVHGNRGRISGADAQRGTTAKQIVALGGWALCQQSTTRISANSWRKRKGSPCRGPRCAGCGWTAGLARPRTRRAPRHRSRRQRMARAGMLVQIDGSHHRWLGAETPLVTLLAAIDDATGEPCWGRVFREQEDAAGYLALLLGLVSERGLSAGGLPRPARHLRPSRAGTGESGRTIAGDNAT